MYAENQGYYKVKIIRIPRPFIWTALLHIVIIINHYVSNSTKLVSDLHTTITAQIYMFTILYSDLSRQTIKLSIHIMYNNKATFLLRQGYVYDNATYTLSMKLRASQKVGGMNIPIYI